MRTQIENNILTIFLEGRIDTNNAPAVEAELLAQVGQNPGADVKLDAEKLEYISSAGLRVLMKLRKQQPLTVENVSREVYDIFETTGFTELLDVKKALRRISVDGLEPIGAGATAKVYRLDAETVVKVFNPNTSPAIIQQENERSRNAFLNGIPTAISYDLVRVGDCCGAVYELLDAQDFLTILENDKAHLEQHIRGFAAAMRRMNQIVVDPTRFLPAKQGSIAALPMLSQICTEEELGKLKKLYESIPDRSTFIHGDCHPGNIMVQNGELVLIDLMSCGSGHPVFDLVSMCSVYHLPRDAEARQATPLLRSFTEDETARIWNTYLRAYLETDDEAFLRKAERQISVITAARMLFAAAFIPGLLSPEHISGLKQAALAYVDEGVEPLCF